MSQLDKVSLLFIRADIQENAALVSHPILFFPSCMTFISLLVNLIWSSLLFQAILQIVMQGDFLLERRGGRRERLPKPLFS